MLPIIFKTGVALLVGSDAASARRLLMLDGAGFETRVFAPSPPCAELRVQCGEGRFVEGLPRDADFAVCDFVFITNLDYDAAALLKARARKCRAGCLVNVEDVPALCDFNVPAIVRRGDLLLTVSTGGASPSLARRLRQWLETRFPKIWGARLEQLGVQRAEWKREGATMHELAAKTDHYIDKKGWLT